MTLVLSVPALILSGPPTAADTTYATWIMVWYGHDQGWWKPDNADASKNLIDGEWKTLDWVDTSQYSPHLDGIRNAGVNVVIADLTNGWSWLDARCREIQRLCAEKGMQFCVAENSLGNTAQFESHARDIWNNFAGPDAPYAGTYFHYQGKPLIVCYAIRDWYQAYLKSDSPFRSRFSLVWASGEDSDKDKWGWQLEPWVGGVPSTEAMFVTPAVRWNPADAALWRTSLAWLDYNFALARKSNPAYIIVGSYDDPTERNTWLVCDTSACEPGRQIRDKTGALNPAAYYERVKQWITGTPSTEPGGVLPDGAYRMVHPSSGKQLGILDTETASQGAPGAVLGEREADKSPNGLFWFYHVGGDHYRIIALQSGLALEAPAKSGGNGPRVAQNWNSTDARQRWTLTRAAGGSFAIRNDITGQALALERSPAKNAPATLRPPADERGQHWRLSPMLTLSNPGEE